MEPGDIIIDGGNEWFPNSIRRAKNLETKGLQYIGMGISGGEEGARKGPSLMPGGPKEAYDAVEPIFSKCAAQVERTGPCVGYLGPVGTVRAEVDQTASLVAKNGFLMSNSIIVCNREIMSRWFTMASSMQICNLLPRCTML
jgi:hypothetical protein